MAELIQIRFLNWSKFNPRKDIKTHSWFALSNRITEHDEIQTLSDREFRAFVHLLCVASLANKNGDVVVNLGKAVRVTGIELDTFLKTLDKLITFGICSDDVRDTYASRTDDERDPNATEQDKTLHNRTEQDTREESPDSHPPNVKFEFKKAIELYPLKTKGPKAEERFHSQIKTESDESELHTATRNYVKMLALDTWRAPKQTYAAFLGTKATGYFWRDFIDWKPETKKVETPEERIERMANQRAQGRDS